MQSYNPFFSWFTSDMYSSIFLTIFCIGFTSFCTDFWSSVWRCFSRNRGQNQVILLNLFRVTVFFFLFLVNVRTIF